jgi:hypothetical protein
VIESWLFATDAEAMFQALEISPADLERRSER